MYAWASGHAGQPESRFSAAMPTSSSMRCCYGSFLWYLYIYIHAMLTNRVSASQAIDFLHLVQNLKVTSKCMLLDKHAAKDDVMQHEQETCHLCTCPSLRLSR